MKQIMDWFNGVPVKYKLIGGVMVAIVILSVIAEMM